MKAKKEAMEIYYKSLCVDGLAKKEDCTEEENLKFSHLYEDELPDNIFMNECHGVEDLSYYKYILAENIARNSLFSIAKKLNNITSWLVTVGIGIVVAIIMCIAILMKLG